MRMLNTLLAASAAAMAAAMSPALADDRAPVVLRADASISDWRIIVRGDVLGRDLDRRGRIWNDDDDDDDDDGRGRRGWDDDDDDGDDDDD
jgi:hypothetical protein